MTDRRSERHGIAGAAGAGRVAGGTSAQWTIEHRDTLYLSFKQKPRHVLLCSTFMFSPLCVDVVDLLALTVYRSEEE